IDDLVANFIASLPAEEVYQAAQERGFTWGAVRAPEALLEDAHLHDRGFWKEVEHPELARSYIYPGEAAIYTGSPWRISRRPPLRRPRPPPPRSVCCANPSLSMSIRMAARPGSRRKRPPATISRTPCAQDRLRSHAWLTCRTAPSLAGIRRAFLPRCALPSR